jgi:putative photosynthetic complex assembly protein 2
MLSPQCRDSILSGNLVADPNHPLVAVVVAVGAWWLSTGLILIAVRQADAGGRSTAVVMTGMSLAGLAGFAMLLLSRDAATPVGSYVGFFGALLIWAWHEAAFLTGALTGPRKGECPAGLSGLARFRAAFLAVRDHELAILATSAVLLAILAGGENLFGLATFLLLWVMRIMAKMVIFLGAPNAISELMPARISHLKSYFNTNGVTALFPFVIAASAGLFAVLCTGVVEAHEPYSAVGHVLLASFVALAMVEMFFLVLPVSDAALWRWAAPEAGVQTAGAAINSQPDTPAGNKGRQAKQAGHANLNGRN